MRVRPFVVWHDKASGGRIVINHASQVYAGRIAIARSIVKWIYEDSRVARRRGRKRYWKNENRVSCFARFGVSSR